MDLKLALAGGVAAMTAEIALPLVRRSGTLLPRLIRLFGDLPLQPRPGRLNRNAAAFREGVRTLEPLDILLERGPLRLSDTFIPGYFKHAAVFLGDAADEVAGRPVLEARRDGVRLSPLPSPRDLDTLAIFRDQTLSPEQRVQLRSRAFAEVGKSYDFRFDGDDRQRQFCSKMVAQLFRHLPLVPAAGGQSILLPDHIARLALVQPAALSLEMLLVDGRAVPSGSRRLRLKGLLGGAN